MTWARWPVAAPPPFFGSVRHYDDLVEALVASGVILDRAMVYWYVRPSDQHPTIEFRTADVMATVDEAVLLAALARALVSVALEDIRRGEPAPVLAPELLQAAHWRAARDGLEGNGVDAFSGRPRPAWDLVRALVERVRPVLAASGDLDTVTALLTAVRTAGSGAARQRATFARREDPRDVVDALAEQTLAGLTLPPGGQSTPRAVSSW
jgi:carboxylate-amine ligase